MNQFQYSSASSIANSMKYWSYNLPLRSLQIHSAEPAHQKSRAYKYLISRDSLNHFVAGGPTEGGFFNPGDKTEIGICKYIKILRRITSFSCFISMIYLFCCFYSDCFVDISWNLVFPSSHGLLLLLLLACLLRQVKN